ncbi:cell wall protein DAN4 [Drosophila obscura]|uniref:cell wall protein DAN4 n=1 Tax=Drosophila obscura TaxID=7282 RepID=UPI001BB13339|nr:cell wall protein DAN4 [Drosophila obscura]
MAVSKFQIFSLALIAILLAPATVDAVCGRCKNSHACISETQFQLCFDGVRDQSQNYTCPSERAICTDYYATCMANSTTVLKGCGDVAVCGVCPDVSTKFTCTSRNTFAACNNGVITAYTQTCKDNYVCSATSAATGTPCVSHCKGNTGDVCDLPGQISANEDPIQTTLVDTSPVTTVTTSDDSSVTTVNTPTATTQITTLDPTTDSSTVTLPTDSTSTSTPTETTPTTVSLPTEPSTSPSPDPTPTTVNPPTDTTPTTVTLPTDSTESTPTTVNPPTDTTPTTVTLPTDSTESTPTTVNTPTETTRTTPTTVNTPTETTPTPTTEPPTTPTTAPAETVYCQGISTAGRYAIPGDTVCTSYINCIYRENSWKGVIYNCVATKPYFNATAFGCGTTKPPGPGCTDV